MIVRRGVYFVVLSADAQRELGRFATRTQAEQEHALLLSGDSQSGRPSTGTNQLRDFIILKSRAPTLATAASLVRKHGGKVRGHRQTADSWRFKQAERDLFVDGSHYTEELEAGVFVVLAKPLEEAAYSLLADAFDQLDEVISYSEALGPAAFAGAMAYDQLGLSVIETGDLGDDQFPCMPYGRAQFLRTGSGFWRQDHGEPFLIDKNLLKLIYKNTLIRARPLRGDYMHWTNQDSQHPAQYRPAGIVDPADLQIQRWVDPLTKKPELGIFGPVAWYEEAAGYVQRGLNQISPVIDWEYKLRHDTLTYSAGTYLGPTIIKWALVDEGFFWMDPVRL